MIELVAVLVIVGVIGAVALPKMWSSGYDELVFAQEATAAFRYAQRSALAKQRNVCVALTATTLTLTYASAYGTGSACNTNLQAPGGGSGAYVINAQHGRTFGTSASFTTLTLNGAGTAFPSSVTFDRTGAPSASVALTLNNGQQVLVESGTGYARYQ